MSWHNLLDHTKNGIRATLRNAAIALREHDGIKGKLAFNEFTDCVVDSLRPAMGSADDRPWTEHDDLSATEWLQGQGIHVGSSIASDAANRVAYERRFHPVVEWLEGLNWDRRRTPDQLAHHLSRRAEVAACRRFRPSLPDLRRRACHAARLQGRPPAHS